MSYLERVIADRAVDEAAWYEGRRPRVCASDAAKLSKRESLPLYLNAKLKDGGWHGNAYSKHGHDLEIDMLAWAGIPKTEKLFHAEDENGFAATPDGILVAPDGRLILAECKTTIKAWKTIPLAYYRQVWWAQYVLGAEQTKFIWDVHENFVRTDLEPHITIIDRDDKQINKMLAIAYPLLAALRAALQFEQEIAA